MDKHSILKSLANLEDNEEIVAIYKCTGKYFYSVKEIADLLNVCTKTILKAITYGDLNAKMVGKAWQISLISLHEFLIATDWLNVESFKSKRCFYKKVL